MLILKPSDIRPSEITSKSNYLNRRDFVKAGAIAGAVASGAAFAAPALGAIAPPQRGAKLEGVGKSPFSTDEPANSYEDITTYNNYYEFGTGKGDPSANAGDFRARPWSITVDGHAEKTGTFQFED
ncbi:MAG: twin-arginine translocation signal domain-containing protein, partial [Proteobacteria bacterium]|nr:twin-arginine translocation signal domain-containing protein [Pseudomonadota bacterium]